MTKPWFKNYPVGSNDEITNNRYGSMLDLLEQSTQRFAEHSAFQSFGEELSYSQVEELSKHFASYLQNKLELKKGDRVALMCPNILPFAISMWGIIRCGGVQVNVNPLYSPHELEHQLNDAQVDTIVVFSSSTATLAEIIENTQVKNVIVVELDDLVNKGLPSDPVNSRIENVIPFLRAIEEGKRATFIQPELSHSDLLFLQYTGGTTGLSKGAMLSHGNIISNILQYQEFAKNMIDEGNEIIITAIPMYHIFALSVNTLSYFSFGTTNVLIANPRDMPSFVETWKHTKATIFTGVNTLFNGLLHTPGFSDIDFSSLKLTVGGGAPVQEAVSQKWQEITGKRIKEGYGLSETSPVLSLNLGTDSTYIPGIGVPLPSTDISIRDDDGNPVADGESGELCAKGPQVMQGYWKNEEATRQSMTDDGYFKTGDIAMIDEHGFFHIVDRKKDMILVSGFNVYPNEIEAVMANMPGTLESACIGVPDERTGESPKLFVVKTDDTLTENQVTDFCRKNLTGYKIPKQVVFIDELPKSTVGKLLRRELRDK
ncbi:MAG: AMP-binding protein [Kangiellaceae bacterium]|nr:AMP-binding protein [Kangiellaceae bacterium]